MEITGPKWTARNAWRCALALVILEFLISVGLRVAQTNHSFSGWVRDNEYFILSTKVFRAFAWLGLAYVLSRTPSLRSFMSGAGLSQHPTLLGWGAAWLGAAIGLIALYGASRGWTTPSRVVHSFYSRGGEPLLFFVLFVTSIGPFFEEVVLRGFLYVAFRGTYGRALSTFLVVAITSYFHWNSIHDSLCTAVCLISLWVLLCLLRERTGSVWNCVLVHAAYNASQTLTWPTYIGPLLLLLPICLLKGTARKTGPERS